MRFDTRSVKGRCPRRRGRAAVGGGGVMGEGQEKGRGWERRWDAQGPSLAGVWWSECGR